MMVCAVQDVAILIYSKAIMGTRDIYSANITKRTSILGGRYNKSDDDVQKGTGKDQI
jgi:hypothetical protein